MSTFQRTQPNLHISKITLISGKYRGVKQASKASQTHSTLGQGPLKNLATALFQVVENVNRSFHCAS